MHDDTDFGTVTAPDQTQFRCVLKGENRSTVGSTYLGRPTGPVRSVDRAGSDTQTSVHHPSRIALRMLLMIYQPPTYIALCSITSTRLDDRSTPVCEVHLKPPMAENDKHKCRLNLYPTRIPFLRHDGVRDTTGSRATPTIETRWDQMHHEVSSSGAGKVWTKNVY